MAQTNFSPLSPAHHQCNNDTIQLNYYSFTISMHRIMIENTCVTNEKQ